jgi:uncharacterized protein YlxW (UPF0749 family)
VDAQAVVEEKPRAVEVHSDHGWVWQVTALSVGLGVMLALAIKTTDHIRKAGLVGRVPGVYAAVLAPYKDRDDRQQEEIRDLRKQLNKYEENINNSRKSEQLLTKEIRDAKALAGLSPVQGPGLKIILRDSPPEEQQRIPNLPAEEMAGFLIHDQDLNGLINELKAAGAQALAISGADGKHFERIVAMTTTRCVGPTAVVNGVSLSAPYTILAIGEPKNLRKALEMPNGYVQNRGLELLKMIVIDESDHLVLPEYSGGFSTKYARPTAQNP